MREASRPKEIRLRSLDRFDHQQKHDGSDGCHYELAEQTVTGETQKAKNPPANYRPDDSNEEVE